MSKSLPSLSPSATMSSSYTGCTDPSSKRKTFFITLEAMKKFKYSNVQLLIHTYPSSGMFGQWWLPINGSSFTCPFPEKKTIFRTIHKAFDTAQFCKEKDKLFGMCAFTIQHIFLCSYYQLPQVNTSDFSFLFFHLVPLVPFFITASNQCSWKFCVNKYIY